MIYRRHFLAGATALAGLRASPSAAEPGGVPANNVLAFRVSRNGSEIGTHTIRFVRAAGALTARIEANFRVHFGPISFYRYHHVATEQWQDGAFVALHSETDDNGTRYQVHAARAGDAVRIEATNLPTRMAPARTLPLTHWAVADWHSRLFNPQNGKLLEETLQPRGPCTVALADGARIPATRFALAGPAPIDDYYDTTKLWAALDAVKDGSTITYRRL